jgi:hypothetical protein
MNKYIYFSKQVRKNNRIIEKLITEDNEGVFWYVHIKTDIIIEAIFYNNKSGVLKQSLLYKDVIDKNVLSTILFTENTYIQVKDKTFDSICIIKINSLIKYIEIIDILNESSDFVFRGQKNKEWSLTASVFRNNYDHNKEHNIYKEIRRNRFKEFTNNVFLDNIIHMQHYGVPTRLLDWSRNPLVPLLFACSESNSDGRVYAYKPNKIYEFDSDAYNDISTYFNEDFNLCKPSPSSIQLLVSLVRKSLPQSIFIESSYENERIRAQSGLFSIYIDIRPRYIELIREHIIGSTSLYSKYSSKMDSKILSMLARSNEDEMKSYLINNKKINLKNDIYSDKEIALFINDLIQNNFWDVHKSNYETNLSLNSLDFIIPYKSKGILRTQLERLNISSMTVYPDSAGFVQYINDKYEREG